MWDIVLRHDGEPGLSQQIYLALKTNILTGAITQGEALPSTRELAKNLGVSRNTVCIAYDMLWTEGFIISRQGAPSRVAEGLQIRSATSTGTRPKDVKRRPDVLWDFKTGQPDLSAFPWTQWNGMIKSAAETLSERHFAYSGPKGYAPLCEQIARWLLRARNMQVNPKDVFITSGATQALHLLVDILHQNGRGFALEDPSHPGVRTIIEDKGYPLCFLPVDDKGADIASIQDTGIAAVYVTPSHQFPLGGILPANRRTALIRKAGESEFYIIEDDYDSEFRYTGSPVSPIYSMDPSRVIYVGTFSKTLFPALRIGFVVLPEALQSDWRHSRNYMDVQNPMLEQAALTEFLQTRRMDKHIRRMTRLYSEKRDLILDALRETFGDAAQAHGDASGLHMALRFPGRTFPEAFIRRCEDRGIRVAPVSQYCAVKTEHSDQLLIGYGHLQKEKIRDGIKILGSQILA